ncbi:site-specific DNA-methyltransferase [Candidatus Uhrbacteria bacterium]|nr:site-specific DNA-methyltransferase [Candidatus Uhrbacteria bacterium]
MNTQKIGNAIIYHADCLDAFRKLKPNSIDLIATDPPYFLDGMDDGWRDDNLKRKKAKANAVGGLPIGMKFDPEQGRRLQGFFSLVSNEALRTLKPGGFLLAFSQGRLFHRMAVAAEDSGFEVRDMLIWEHNGGQGKAFTQNHFIRKMEISENERKRMIAGLRGRKTPQLRPKFESILLAQKPKDGTFVENWNRWNTGLIKVDFLLECQQTTIFKYSKPIKEKMIDHMTVKPVDLMERLIDVFCIEGQTVLDPFLGSGTTGVAALGMRRKFIGFEVEERYVKMAIERLKKFL